MDYIPILFLVVLVSGTIYKLLNVTQKMEDPLVGPIQRQSKKFHEADNFDMNLAHAAYKERKEIERILNDYMTEVNIKKEK